MHIYKEPLWRRFTNRKHNNYKTAHVVNLGRPQCTGPSRKVLIQKCSPSAKHQMLSSVYCWLEHTNPPSHRDSSMSVMWIKTERTRHAKSLSLCVFARRILHKSWTVNMTGYATATQTYTQLPPRWLWVRCFRPFLVGRNSPLNLGDWDITVG